MPDLRHGSADGDFDITKSAVAEWLCELPEVRQYVFDAAKESGAIVYDGETGMWRGADR